ncbi:MAG TPA: metal-dependent phosphohydrolase, partial [Thermovirga lienii]|nr:metal-dependent phosphohydrolase [Thermovirga lienii]
MYPTSLHDIGKTAVPYEILTKPGKLTPEEYRAMQKHTIIAGEVIEAANKEFRDKFGVDSYLALARDIALYHHEKWNGKGYPYGLSGQDIPLAARIVALADVYDALRSKRPYKEPWSHEDAMREIIRQSGEHFDPVIVEAFIELEDRFCEISKTYSIISQK